MAVSLGSCENTKENFESPKLSQSEAKLSLKLCRSQVEGEETGWWQDHRSKDMEARKSVTVLGTIFALVKGGRKKCG